MATNNQETQNKSAAILARIQHDFQYHAPTPEKRDLHEQVRGLLKVVAMEVVALTPVSREQSLAVTHLEQALMWANAAIARNDIPVEGQ